MIDIYNRVLESWSAGDLSLVQPLGHEVTGARFRAAGLDPAEDFIAFHAIVGGMTDGEMDSDLWSCWRLEKVVGDWLIHSHIHVARAESAILSSIWVDCFSGGEPEKVSDSLEDFLDRYLKKDETHGSISRIGE